MPLSVADMEFCNAPPIREALKNLADTTILGYTHETEEYYDAVISWQERRHDFHVKKEWILTTPGVVNALGILVDAATKPAESVLILTPVYYPFDMSVIAKTRHIVYSTLINNDGHYEIDYADVEKKCRRDDVTAMLFCNPHNPVGRVWTREELEKVGNICCDNGVFIIDDEIHNDLIMPGYKHTVMANVNDRIKDNIAVCTAPSKTFNIAGLQCSNIIIPNITMNTKAYACAHSNLQTGLNIAAYTACKAAYNECEDWLDELLPVIDGNAKYIECFMSENFPEVKVCPLEGTYLLWVDMRGLGMTHVELKEMLENAGIILDYGEMFGIAGRGFERFNIACARETLEKTMARFKSAVEEVRAKWAKEGKPVHKELVVGDKLENFVYDSTRGRNIDLSWHIKKPTLIVFARFYECSICQVMLKVFKALYPAFKAGGRDVKFVLQSDVQTLEKHRNKYPFELIADPEAKFYDKYNIFEADGLISMIAGDKLFEKVAGKDIKKLLHTNLVNTLVDAVSSDSGDDNEAGNVRQNQLWAFVMVDENMRISYSHYSKTISDIPFLGKKE